MNINSVVFIYTLQCSGYCDICCFGCSQQKKKRLSMEKVQKIIDELPSSVRLIGFTGGECFLYYEEILNLIRYAFKRKIQTTITTNCFWAISDEIVYKRLYELKSLNIRSIKISIDEYHLKHIPVENIKRFLRIGKYLKIRIVIGCTVLKNSKKMGDYLDLFEDELISVPFVEHYCYPIGNASSLDEDMLYKYPQIATGCFDGGVISITPEGNAYPCGSMCGIVEERLLGNIYQEGILTLIERAEKDELNNYLYEYGTAEIVNNMKKKGIIPFDQCYVDGCHACFYLFKNFKIQDIKDNV